MTAAMTSTPARAWSVALRLGRVSNLPTVTSNVLAAIALSGARPSAWRIVIVCLAMSLLYVAGMYLNDAFDREIDARERPDRPIPSGQITASTVFAAGFALLGSGVIVVAALCLATGVTWTATISAAVLAALIIVYDLRHKRIRWSPIVMGLCRVGVYTTASLAVSGQLDRAVVIAAACVLAYLIGLTYVARSENLRDIGALWPLGLLSVPFIACVPSTVLSWMIYAGFALWTMRAVRLVTRHKIRAAVTSLIAGISLLDALFAAGRDRPVMAGVAVAAFALTYLLQRVIPGT